MSDGLRSLAVCRNGEILTISLKNIVVQEGFNVRSDFGNIEELAKSIIASGQKEPIKVRLSDDGKKALLVNGERRFRAVAYANEHLGASIETMRCIKVERGANEESLVVEMLLCNAGKPLEPLEEAEAFKRLLSFGLSNEVVASKIGKSATYVTERLQLLSASHEVREVVKAGKITVTAASRLSRASKEVQKSVADRANNGEKIRVRDAEEATGKSVSVVSTGGIRKFNSKVDQLLKGNHLNPNEKAFWLGVGYAVAVMLGKETFKVTAPKVFLSE